MSKRANVAAIAAALLGGAFAGKVGAATYFPTLPTAPRYFYVTNLMSGTVSQYVFVNDETTTPNATPTGRLRPNGVLRCSSGGQPSCIVVNPSSSLALCGTFGGGSLNALISYQVGTSNLTTTPQGAGRLRELSKISPFAGPNDLSFALSGNNVYYPNLDGNTINNYSINTSTGVLSAMSPATATAGNYPETPVIHPSLSKAYCPCYLDNTIALYNITSNALVETGTRITLAPGTPGPISMAITRNVTGSNSTRLAYCACYDASSIYVFSVDSAGALTQRSVVTRAGMTNPTCVAIDNTCTYVYTSNDGSNNVSAYRINDVNLGTLSFINNYNAGGNPARLIIDPTNKFLYVANRTTNDVSIFSINQGNGQLTALATTRAQQGPYGLAIAGGDALKFVPKVAYVSNSTDDTIGVFTVAANGTLSPASPATVPSGGSQPLWLEIEPLGRYLYCINRNDDNGGVRGIQAFSINQSSGALTALGSNVLTDAGPRRFAIDPTGSWLYLACDTAQTLSVYKINSDGTLTRQTGLTVNLNHAVWGLTIDATGQFLLIPNQANATQDSYSIDLATGALTFVDNSNAGGTTPYTIRNDPTGKFVYVGTNAGSEWSAYTLSSAGVYSGPTNFDGQQTLVIQVDVHPTGQWAYGAAFNSDRVTKWQIDGTTGALSARANYDVDSHPQGLIVDPSGRFLYVPNSGSRNISMFSIDQGNGTLTSLGTVNCGNGPHTVTIFGVLQ